MTLDKLQHALDLQKTANAEEDYVEVVCRALEVKRDLLFRLLYAMGAVNQALREQGQPQAFAFNYDSFSLGSDAYNYELPNLELRAAYREAMFDGVLRVLIARAILDGKSIYLRTKQFIPREQAAQLCEGCPMRLECMTESLSTPDDCWFWERSTLVAKPLRLNKTAVEVELTQPAGRRFLALSKLETVGDPAVNFRPGASQDWRDRFRR